MILNKKDLTKLRIDIFYLLKKRSFQFDSEPNQPRKSSILNGRFRKHLQKKKW